MQFAITVDTHIRKWDCVKFAEDLGYDRAWILFTRHTGWDLHQLRHFLFSTRLGEQSIPLQVIMAKTRHRNRRAPRCDTSA